MDDFETPDYYLTYRPDTQIPLGNSASSDDEKEAPISIADPDFEVIDFYTPYKAY